MASTSNFGSLVQAPFSASTRNAGKPSVDEPLYGEAFPTRNFAVNYAFFTNKVPSNRTYSPLLPVAGSGNVGQMDASIVFPGYEGLQTLFEGYSGQSENSAVRAAERKRKVKQKSARARYLLGRV